MGHIEKIFSCLDAVKDSGVTKSEPRSLGQGAPNFAQMMQEQPPGGVDPFCAQPLTPNEPQSSKQPSIFDLAQPGGRASREPEVNVATIESLATAISSQVLSLKESLPASSEFSWAYDKQKELGGNLRQLNGHLSLAGAALRSASSDDAVLGDFDKLCEEAGVFAAISAYLEGAFGRVSQVAASLGNSAEDGSMDAPGLIYLQYQLSAAQQMVEIVTVAIGLGLQDIKTVMQIQL